MRLPGGSADHFTAQILAARAYTAATATREMAVSGHSSAFHRLKLKKEFRQMPWILSRCRPKRKSSSIRIFAPSLFRLFVSFLLLPHQPQD